MMEFDANPLDGLTRVALRGRLDSPGVDEIETRFLASIVPPGRHAVVDMTGLEFLSSMGIRLLIMTARSLSQKKLKMVLFGAQPMVQESLDHVSLDAIIPVAADEAQALALARA